MAELVDAHDSKSCVFGHVGSIPTLGTEKGFFGSLFLLQNFFVESCFASFVESCETSFAESCFASFAESCETSFEEYCNIAIYKYNMGTTKAELFTKKQNETASLLKAIAHPARIAIVEYLMNVESCICGDIVNKLPLAQPTVSQHLKELKLAGIIQGSIEGNSICYCLNEKTIQKLKVYFETIENKISKQIKCC